MSTFDIAVFGATGFTGKQAAQTLCQNPELKIILAGRDLRKLEAVKANCRHSPEIRRVDAMDRDAVRKLVEDSKVILNFAGPFAKYAEPLIASVAELGRSYADITGETVFIADMIERYQAKALETGATLIPMAGFDSVPGDLTTYLALKAAGSKGWRIDRMDHYYKVKGGFNGGTLETAMTMQESDSIARYLDENVLIPDPSWPKPKLKNLYARYEPYLKAWATPFFMHQTNAAVVRRARYLMGEKKVAEAPYFEHMLIGKGLSGKIGAEIGRVGLAAFAALSSIALGRKLIRTLGPAPGEGPSEKARTEGFYSGTLIAREGDQVRIVVRMKASGDPGNIFTNLCATEIAKLLWKEKPLMNGFTTGALAFGDKLITALENQGVKISTDIVS